MSEPSRIVLPVGVEASSSLLITKFQIPSGTSPLLARPRLEQRLAYAMAQGRVCQVVAPAGMGKTMLVVQGLKQIPYPVAWLHLDVEDDAPARFWAYFVASLRTVYPTLFNEPGITFDDPRQLINRLICELTLLNTPCVLVLNDLHHIRHPLILEPLDTLLRHAPPELRVILISRERIPFRLTRLLTLNTGYLTLDDLRFTDEEGQAFFDLRLTDRLAGHEVATLMTLTGGWAVMMEIAAYGLQQSIPPDALITHFNVHCRHISHYLSTEIFAHLPPTLQAFALKTALLSGLSPELCAILSDTPDSQALLEALERRQLLTLPLDSEGHYRHFHPLWKAYLECRLMKDHTVWVGEILANAGDYPLSGQYVEATLNQLLTLKQWDIAQRVIHAHARQRLLEGSAEIVLAWLDRLPPDAVQSSPRLSLYQAWAWLMQGNIRQAECVLNRIDLLLVRHGNTTPEGESSPLLQGELAAIRAEIAHLQGDFTAQAEHAREALRKLPPENSLIRGVALTRLGYACWLEGDTIATRQVFNASFSTLEHQDGEWTQWFTECARASLRLLEGKLHDSYAIYQTVLAATLRMESPPMLAIGLARIGTASILYAWNQLDSAAQMVREGLMLAKPWTYNSSVLLGYLLLAQIEQSQRQEIEAGRVLKAFKTLIDSASLNLFQPLYRAQQAHLNLQKGDLPAALRWARHSGLKVDDDLPLTVMGMYLTYARVMVAGRSLHEANHLLERLTEVASANGWGWLWLEIQLVKAIALWKQSQPDSALETMQKALEHARPEGYIRLFVDHGSVIETLLRRMDDARDPLGYTGEILRAFEDHSHFTPQITLKISPRITQEALTPRELEVLALMAQGISNGEISRRLHITTGTCKTHARNIFRKLDCNNRVQAIRKALDKGIIET